MGCEMNASNNDLNNSFDMASFFNPVQVASAKSSEPEKTKLILSKKFNKLADGRKVADIEKSTGKVNLIGTVTNIGKFSEDEMLAVKIPQKMLDVLNGNNVTVEKIVNLSPVLVKRSIFRDIGLIGGKAIDLPEGSNMSIFNMLVHGLSTDGRSLASQTRKIIPTISPARGEIKASFLPETLLGDYQHVVFNWFAEKEAEKTVNAIVRGLDKKPEKKDIESMIAEERRKVDEVSVEYKVIIPSSWDSLREALAS